MEGERSQARVVAFLENGGLGEPVERVDTHGAHVFLGREHAWKMKRAVCFRFMDLSTLAKREATTRAELELNRRTAPELYRRVLPVTRADGGRLALGGAGEPVEWLLEMRRFPAEAQLDRVAAGGELTGAIVDRLARVVAEFHAIAEPRPEAGGAAGTREVVEGNAGDLASLAPAVFARAAVAALNRAAVAELDRHAGLLDRRREAGEVRRCHGDLHLANIVLLHGRPVLFDCLEFSEPLASIDVLYDLAFLVMDLLERGLRSEAWRLLQAYNDRRVEDEGLALMPLFLSVRAAIRAKVTGFTALSPEHGGDRKQLSARARAYLGLALAALEPSPAMLVAIGGRSGSGKSTLAADVAPQIGAMPGAVVLRSDVVRKQLLGREQTERLPPEAYSREMTEQAYHRVVTRAGMLLRAGCTVVCDAVYGLGSERHAIERVATDLGIPFRGFWLEAPESVLETRVTARTGDASDADVAVVRRQRELADAEAVTWRRVRADRDLGEVADELAKALEANPQPV